MSKKFLTLALAALTAGSAFAIGPKRMTTADSRFNQAPVKAKVQKSIPTRADEPSLNYSLADVVYTTLNFKNLEENDTVYQAFEFTPEAATKFAGNQLTSINITPGASIANGEPSDKNILEDVTVFLTKGLNEDPFYVQKGKLGSTPYELNRIILDTPYDIKTGEGFYVGYYFRYTDELANSYYITVDGLPTKNEAGCWVGIVDGGGPDGIVDGADDPEKPHIAWSNYAENLGNLCIGCTLQGDNLPRNGVKLDEIAGPFYCAPGKAFEYNFLVKSTSVAVETLELTYTIGDAEPQSDTFQVDSVLSYNDYAILTLDRLVCNTEGLEVPLKFQVTKVNGEDNTCEENTLTSSIQCYDPSRGFKRVHLIEEGTGTWCGFCPLGIVMMEYVGEKYPDFFARVAIHANQGGTSDPMYQPSTSSWISNYAQGFPCGRIDRVTEIEALSYADYKRMVKEMDDFVKRNRTIPSLIGFTDINYSIDEKGKMSVDTKVKCAFDMPNDNRYRIGYYLTQDSVGPFRQTNYYANGQYGACDGWETLGRSVQIKYNEVCRLASGGAFGFTNSLPATFKQGEEYTHSTSLSVTNVNSAACKLIAYIYDAQTGEISNAKVVDVVNSYYISGVESVSADAEIVGRKYYNLNGMEVSEPADGLYIVRTIYSDGTVKAAKVMVK
ncbi:MAG: hypothetical protein K2J70_07215 [Muribaculaceae bacterium]|nr:hypothetical protein [Muribaculaceae bacterium]